MEYEQVIGLEIHVQLKTKSKMFCRCDNYSREAKPNMNTCPVCLGMPGTLPVANKKAIGWTILTGFALNCEICKMSKFDRKNYFYPDLPKGYQISQFDLPFCKKGFLTVAVSDGGESYTKKIGITRIHLEEDAGKLLHPESEAYSLVDLNRAGTPLMEIVTEPDISSSKEAKLFLQSLRTILLYLDVSDADMEEGNLRCDANISLRKKGSSKLGKKVEIKNMNSFKALERALEYETKRQKELLDHGEQIIQETRGWNDSKGKTISQRGKEESHDYRYFPEPDLPPINHKGANAIDLEKIKAELPELPDEKRKRFMEEYALGAYDASVLTAEPTLAKFFEKAVEDIPEKFDSTEVIKTHAKKISNWITSELVNLLRINQIHITESKIKPQDIADMVELIEKGEISGKMGKEVFQEMFKTGVSPSQIIKKKGVSQISDTKELGEIIDKVLSENQNSIDDYKRGKVQAIGFLVGQVMKETKGQANPGLVNKLLKQKLEAL